MKYLIRCDMEGLTGVTSYAVVTPGAELYERHRDILMDDLTAVIDGLRRLDPSCAVVLYDEHFFGRNVRLEALPAGCVAIAGKPPYRADWVGGLDQSIHAMAMVGFHAMAGTPGGTLPHTYEHDILAIQVNGKLVGEVGVEAALAGELGIPMVLYTGDSAGAAEAAELVPGLVTAAVKTSLGEGAAACLSRPDATELLQAAALRAARQDEWPEPLRLGTPVRLEVRLDDTPYRAAFMALHGQTMAGDTVVLDRPRLAEAWADYWRLKEAAQAALAAG